MLTVPDVCALRHHVTPQITSRHKSQASSLPPNTCLHVHEPTCALVVVSSWARCLTLTATIFTQERKEAGWWGRWTFAPSIGSDTMHHPYNPPVPAPQSLWIEAGITSLILKWHNKYQSLWKLLWLSNDMQDEKFIPWPQVATLILGFILYCIPVPRVVGGFI